MMHMGFGSMKVWTCSAKVIEYWMISSLKINQIELAAEILGGIGMCAFGVAGKIFMRQDLMEFIW